MKNASLKFIVVFCCLLSVFANVNAGELVLGSDGKSNYEIVVPEKYPDDYLKASVEQAAELIRKAFEENGVELRVVTEGDMTNGKSKIYLGKTEFAKKHGVDFERMKGWTYTFKVVGDDVIIAGNDQPDPMPADIRGASRASKGFSATTPELKCAVRESGFKGVAPYLATLKAATEFLYKYAGMRFLSPGETEYVPTPTISVPDNLNLVRRPFGRKFHLRHEGQMYGIANGLEVMPKVFTHYGHYHGLAIPSKTYADAHPEYFIYADGKRANKSGQYCFSNPETREMIYRKILDDCDKGYDIVEVGQNDAYRPCECEKCRVLYDMIPTTQPEDGIAYRVDPAWGEKLWIMHRDMALRLQKDRPGKKIMVSAYAVAKNPPKTIKKFPDNMMVQLMRPIDRLKDWPEAVDVPAGYGAYLYTWGNFHQTGYTPIRSARYIENLVNHLVEHDVKLIQINGWPVSYGIEGINIYAFNRFMNDPESKTINELNQEYVDAAYGKAAAPMARFYRKLHQRLDFLPEAMKYSRGIRNPMLLFGALYTPELINELDLQLTNAEKLAKSEGVKRRLANARYEFEFLKHIVNVMYMYYTFQMRQDQHSLDLAIDAVEARNDFIKKHVPNKDAKYYKRKVRQLIQNGRRMNIEPYNWNVEEMRKSDILNQKAEAKSLKVVRADNDVSIDSGFWKNVPAHEMCKARGAREELKEKTTFQIAYDDKNLYVRFEAGMPADLMDSFSARGRDAEIWLQECLNICLSPSGDKSQYYYLNFEPVANSYTDASHGFITDPLHPKFGWNDNSWNGEWSYENKLLKNQNKWVALATFPYKTFNIDTPQKGDIWAANFARVHFKGDIKDVGHKERGELREISVWTDKANVSNTPGEGYFGEIIFE